MKIVVLISANAEWQAVKEIFPGLNLERSPFGEFSALTMGDWGLTLFHGGWGKISAAATAQYVIDHWRPDLLLNLGTCGGFSGTVETGQIILVERTIVYDILEQMGDEAAALQHYATELDLSWLPVELPHPVLRAVLVSADRDLLAADIPLLAGKYGAIAADWESGAIAWVADRNHVRCLILRAVSDLVGAEGGEAYGDLALFHQRTKAVMTMLFQQLPDWLQAVDQG